MPPWNGDALSASFLERSPYYERPGASRPRAPRTVSNGSDPGASPGPPRWRRLPTAPAPHGSRSRPVRGFGNRRPRSRPRRQPRSRRGHRPTERAVRIDGHLALLYGEAVEQLVGVEGLGDIVGLAVLAHRRYLRPLFCTGCPKFDTAQPAVQNARAGRDRSEQTGGLGNHLSPRRAVPAATGGGPSGSVSSRHVGSPNRCQRRAGPEWADQVSRMRERGQRKTPGDWP